MVELRWRETGLDSGGGSWPVEVIFGLNCWIATYWLLEPRLVFMISSCLGFQATETSFIVAAGFLEVCLMLDNVLE